MTGKLQIISYNVVKPLLNKSDVILLQEFLLSDFTVNECEAIMLKITSAATHQPTLVPSRGLSNIWKTKDDISCLHIMYTGSIMGLSLRKTNIEMCSFEYLSLL